VRVMTTVMTARDEGYDSPSSEESNEIGEHPGDGADTLVESMGEHPGQPAAKAEESSAKFVTWSDELTGAFVQIRSSLGHSRPLRVASVCTGVWSEGKAMEANTNKLSVQGPLIVDCETPSSNDGS
jgi:bacillopeptidase F (M6 metalloprotease family)